MKTTPDPLDEKTPTEPFLTPAQQSRMIREMHRALIGDPYNPKTKPGLIQLFTQTHTDYWGDKDAGIIGTRNKVEKLWSNWTKILGAFALVTILAAVGPYLLHLITGK